MACPPDGRECNGKSPQSTGIIVGGIMTQIPMVTLRRAGRVAPIQLYLQTDLGTRHGLSSSQE